MFSRFYFKHDFIIEYFDEFSRSTEKSQSVKIQPEEMCVYWGLNDFHVLRHLAYGNFALRDFKGFFKEFFSLIMKLFLSQGSRPEMTSS